jgi:hypothetical protein
VHYRQTKKIRLLIIISFHFTWLLFTSGCKPGKESDQSAKQAVAQAGDEKLDIEVFRASLMTTDNPTDSMYSAGKVIDNWATETLFYQEALEKMSEDELKIQAQLDEYKKALVNYHYQARIIEANLDTTITAEEIESYYDMHRDNFILKENIVKVNYIKVPVRSPALEKIRKFLGSQKPKEKEQLNTLIMQNAESYFMNDSTWLFIDDIKKEIPRLKDEPDYNLSDGRVFEFTDELYYYYLKINDMKTKNALSPLNFEKRNIRNFIINHRKTQLINEYKRLMLEKAKKSKAYVRF